MPSTTPTLPNRTSHCDCHPLTNPTHALQTLPSIPPRNMSGLPEYGPLTAYGCCDGAVCFDHGRRMCVACGVDYRAAGHPSNLDDGDDQVPILGPGVNRFMPQWDEEILGPADASNIQKDYNNPPKAHTPDQLGLHYCRECQLTWLEGNMGVHAAQSHPFHHSSPHIYAGTRRSLVVFTDGACPSNGKSSAVDASIGVHFGPQSGYNISQRLGNDYIPTNQVAEIEAAVAALQQVWQTIEPARRALIENSLPPASYLRPREIRQFRLIVATDSSYVVECMAKHIKKWSMKDGIYRNEQGRAVHNSDGFAHLTYQVEQLSMVGVQVAWYHVPREFNKQADSLARLALLP
ncbi:ribonuclease H-like domain-containing protein [Ustulina deusta]|nr:ribonuclease H-like domain-containing protein [Ustulina deusta]KAI3333428.1 ribonuclease H-like domain-containing protein [Ustulina deusta]